MLMPYLLMLASTLVWVMCIDLSYGAWAQSKDQNHYYDSPERKKEGVQVLFVTLLTIVQIILFLYHCFG